MAINVPKDSPLYSDAPIKIGGNSDVAGTDYGVGAFSGVAGLSSNSSGARAEYNQNSAKLDAKINTLGGATNYGVVTTDPKTGKTSQSDINAEGAQAGMGFKFAYMPDGTKMQIPDSGTPEQYGMSANPPAPKPGAPAGTTSTTPNDINAQKSELLSQQLATATSTLEKVQARSSADEAALIDSIKQTYAARRLKMEDTNKRNLEGKRIAGITAGRMRYNTAQEDNLLSAEELDGHTRLAEIDAEELSLIVKAKQARSDTDMKGFAEYSTRLTEISKQKIQLLTDLQTATIAADKAIEDKRKAALAEQQTTLNYQQDLATSYARGAYEQLKTLKTDKEKQEYITKLAKDNKIDPQILSGAIQDYQDKEETQNSQIEARDSAAAAREQSVSLAEQRLALAQEKQANGDSGKKYTDGKLVYTDGMVEEAKASLQSGDTFNGVKYNGTGDDGYVDPDYFKALYTNWIENGGTKVGFLKQFPPKDYVNPSAKLPDFLLPPL